MPGEQFPAGRPLAVDQSAQSAQEGVPAFIARPAGAPVYHGFLVLNDVLVDGFVFGMITDFEAEECQYGDAFVVAPDGSRAGLVWEVSDQPQFESVMPLEPERWGVWTVAFPFAMTSRENAARNLASILPDLKPRWEEWKRRFQSEG